jgi:NitT/TauT family transport system ATP-binding protein
MDIEELKKKNLLHLQDVYKFYGSKLILDNIDMSVAHGELCTVVGPSGCGKSTLLRLILGQEPPSSGILLVEGADISEPNRERGIVYQKYSLFPHLTVLENIILGKQLQLGWWERRQQKSALKEEGVYFLKRIGLEEHAEKYPYELSGGMQQRVQIARALAVRPAVLLMDEPFAALDAMTKAALQDELHRVRDETGASIVFVTHDIEEAAYLGDRIAVITGSPGRIEREFDVDLPKPREQIVTRQLPRFLEIRYAVHQAIGMPRHG